MGSVQHEAEAAPVKHHYWNVWTEAAGKRWKTLHSERRRMRGRNCQVSAVLIYSSVTRMVQTTENIINTEEMT